MLDKSAFYKKLGAKIRKLRTDKDMTLEGLSDAAALNLSKTSIVNIEHGGQQVSVYQLVCIASALNVSLESLLQGLLNEEAEIKKLISQKNKELIDSL